MPRKKRGPRNDIKVWGCILEDGTEITTEDEGIVSVVALTTGYVKTIDENNVETIHEDRGKWISYNPRFN